MPCGRRAIVLSKNRSSTGWLSARFCVVILKSSSAGAVSHFHGCKSRKFIQTPGELWSSVANALLAASSRVSCLFLSISPLDFQSPQLFINFLPYLYSHASFVTQELQAKQARWPQEEEREGWWIRSCLCQVHTCTVSDLPNGVRVSPSGGLACPHSPQGEAVISEMGLGAAGEESSSTRENKVRDCPVSGVNGLHWQALNQVQTGIPHNIQVLKEIERRESKR